MRTTIPDHVLDTAGSDLLRRQLLAELESGEGVRIDASQIQRIGLAALQVLASTRVAADQANLGFEIVDPSEPFQTMVALAGIERLIAPLHTETRA